MTQLVDPARHSSAQIVREHHDAGRKLEPGSWARDSQTMPDILHGFPAIERLQSESNADALRQGAKRSMGQRPLEFGLSHKQQAHEFFFLGVQVG